MTHTPERPRKETRTFVIEIPEALTQETFLGVFPLDPLQAQAAPRGLRYADIGVLARRLEVPTVTLLGLLNIRERTYHARKKARKDLPAGTARDLLRLARVTQVTETVYGDELAKAHRWLSRPRVTLGSAERPRSPLELALMPGGEAYITGYLGQIQHGISP